MWWRCNSGKTPGPCPAACVAVAADELAGWLLQSCSYKWVCYGYCGAHGGLWGMPTSLKPYIILVSRHASNLSNLTVPAFWTEDSRELHTHTVVHSGRCQYWDLLSALLIENSVILAVPFRLKPYMGRDLRWWWVKEDKYFNSNSTKRYNIFRGFLASK